MATVWMFRLDAMWGNSEISHINQAVTAIVRVVRVLEERQREFFIISLSSVLCASATKLLLYKIILICSNLIFMAIISTGDNEIALLLYSWATVIPTKKRLDMKGITVQDCLFLDSITSITEQLRF